jgi:hypothetical protein
VLGREAHASATAALRRALDAACAWWSRMRSIGEDRDLDRARMARRRASRCSREMLEEYENAFGDISA